MEFGIYASRCRNPIIFPGTLRRPWHVDGSAPPQPWRMLHAAKTLGQVYHAIRYSDTTTQLRQKPSLTPNGPCLTEHDLIPLKIPPSKHTTRQRLAVTCGWSLVVIVIGILACGPMRKILLYPTCFLPALSQQLDHVVGIKTWVLVPNISTTANSVCILPCSHQFSSLLLSSVQP